MARVAIPHIALKPDPTNANALIPASGASVTVRRRSDNALATVYQAETGSTTVANPLASDANGRVSGWVDRDAYSVTITGTGITMPVDNWDAAPASTGSVDSPWILNASILQGDLAFNVPQTYNGWTRMTGGTVTVAGNAVAAFAHGLGVQPAAVMLTIAGSSGPGMSAPSYDFPSSSDIRVWNGNAGSITVAWVAFA